MNRRLENAQIRNLGSTPKVVDGPRYSRNLLFVFAIVATLVTTLSLKDPLPPPPDSLTLQVLPDPDSLLNLSSLTPSSDAWQSIDTLPILHQEGTTWLLLQSAKPQRLELNGQSFARSEVYIWQPNASSETYVSRGTKELQNFIVPIKAEVPVLLRIDNDDSTKITLRLSEAENVEFLATNTLLIVALSAFSILFILDMLQLVFLRDSWSEHAATLFLSICQMLVLVSQLDQAILQYDLSSSGFAAASWALLGIATLTGTISLETSTRARTARRLAYLALVLSVVVLPNSISTSVTALIAFTVIAITHSSSSLIAKVNDGIFYTLLLLNHTMFQPIWPGDNFSFQAATVAMFSIISLGRCIELVKAYSDQRTEFENLRFRLRHEHSARLYITSSTAHELNNPINFISSGVGLQLEQFGELRDLVDVVFHDVDDPDALALQQRFDSTLRSILNITLDIQAGALRSAASLDHLRGLSPVNNQIMSTFWTFEEILRQALDRVELQYLQSARSMVLLDLTTDEFKTQLSTNLYFISDAIGKLLMIALSQSPKTREVVRVHTMLETEGYQILKISYPGELPSAEEKEQNTDRLDQLEHIHECLRLISCRICCTHNKGNESSTFSVFIPKQGTST